MTIKSILSHLVTSTFDKAVKYYRLIIVFFITFTASFIILTFINESVNPPEGIYEKKISIQNEDKNKTKLIKLEDIRENTAAFDTGEKVVIMKVGEKRSIKDKEIRSSYYNGSFELVKLNKNSALVKFNVYRSINYMYLIAISLVASIFIMLTMSSFIRLSSLSIKKPGKDGI